MLWSRSEARASSFSGSGDSHLEGDCHLGYVWIVSGDHWLRACLRAELIERGLEAIGYEELAQALPEKGMTGPISPDAILLDLCSLEPKPEELKALAATGAPVVVLTARVMREPEWPSCWRPAQVLRRPLTLGQVADVIQRLATRG